MSFEALMGALGTLSKSLSPDDANKDAKVAAAAADGAAAGAAEGGEGGGDGAAAGNTTEGQGQGGAEGTAQGEAGSAAAGAGEGEGKGAGGSSEATGNTGEGEEVPMGKSFSMELEGGEVIEAFDATELLKSLIGRVKGAEAGLKSTEQNAVAVIGKAVEVITAQGGVITDLKKSLDAQAITVGEQAALIKSLREDLDGLRNQPAGRKSVTNPAQVSADSPLVKSLNGGEGEQKGLPPQEFLAKCLSLQKEGKLSLQECALAEAAIGSGVSVDPAIVTKVFSS